MDTTITFKMNVTTSEKEFKGGSCNFLMVDLVSSIINSNILKSLIQRKGENYLKVLQIVRIFVYYWSLQISAYWQLRSSNG